MHTMVVSYFSCQFPVIERIVSYNFHYLLPAGFVSIKITPQTPALLFSFSMLLGRGTSGL